MEIDLHECERLVKQSLGKYAGESDSGGVARWKRVVITVSGLKMSTTTAKQQTG